MPVSVNESFCAIIVRKFRCSVSRKADWHKGFGSAIFQIQETLIDEDTQFYEQWRRNRENLLAHWVGDGPSWHLRPRPRYCRFPICLANREMIAVMATKFHVRVGGQGPAVVPDSWFRRYRGYVVSNCCTSCKGSHGCLYRTLRGMGLSEHSDSGYTKKNQAVDIPERCWNISKSKRQIW